MEGNTETMKIDRDSISPGETLQGVQICPFGEFPNGDRPQHCTREALAEVVADWTANGAREILCDFEHQSEAGGTSDTSAAAWISNLHVDPARGLVGDFKFTDLGADAVTNRRLRFLSVGWFVNKATRTPMRITSVALTNRPNIPVEPVLNREPTDIQPVEERNAHMDKIKEALGLPPEASEEDVLAKLAETKANCDKLAERNKELEDAAAAAEAEKKDAEAEEFAEQNKAHFDKAALKAQFLANREVAAAMVKALRAPAERVVNRAEARTPSIPRTPAGDDEAVLNRYESLSGPEKSEFLEAHAHEINRARIARAAAK